MLRKTREAGVVHRMYILAQALGSVWSTQGLFSLAYTLGVQSGLGLKIGADV